MSATQSTRRKHRRISDPEEAKRFREQRHQEELERMAAAVDELASSDGWRAWLESRARFHNYSFNNSLLIAMQRPDATLVASYRTWQSLGRQVRRGEHGIRILAPMTLKVARGERTHVGISDASTIAQSVAAGRRELGDDDRTEYGTILRFKSVSVFDVSQTDGDELPTLDIEPVDGDSLADRLPLLDAFAESIGYSVEYVELPDGYGGFCDSGASKIAIREALAPNGKVKTLVHELAHALGVTYESHSRGDAEVIVESVAFIVCGALGLDTSGYSVPYVARWGEGESERIREYAERVDELASRLEAACELRDEPRTHERRREAVAA